VRSLYETVTAMRACRTAPHVRLLAAQPAPDAWWSELVGQRDVSDYASHSRSRWRRARRCRERRHGSCAALARAANGGAYWRTGNFSRWMEDPFETSAVVLGAGGLDGRLADPEVISMLRREQARRSLGSTKDAAMILCAMTGFSPKG
jgi:hypothetical protein